VNGFGEKCTKSKELVELRKGGGKVYIGIATETKEGVMG